MTSTLDPVPGLTAAADLHPGDRIRVTQRIVTHAQTWLNEAEGEVLACGPETTGSWFATGKHDKLWLVRIRLRKDDGEETALIVDENTSIERLTRS